MEGNIQIANAEDEEPSSREYNEGNRILDECRISCGPLLQAAMKGDWEAANAFLNEHPNCVQLPITMEKATVLHSAAAAKHANFVEEVLKWMTPGDLELKTIDGDTALHVAAQTGEVKIAKEMVEKNNELPLIHNDKGMIPLHAAAYKRDRKMVDFLFSDSVTPFQRLITPQRIELLLHIVSAGFYDIALEILEKDPSLATANTADGACGRRALEELARKSFAISSKSELSSWKKRLNSC
ncbi:uncharacterized protein LOC133869787 [Alnus glutinosa]|uniref:uncharacterized protein LOC133869787 n=1 Tax=Alnus glutinosa TaxID=3517 RepID=UPI002D78479B|nr:uncharacterized protein LOC133869787 [Alnus glutinosa]